MTTWLPYKGEGATDRQVAEKEYGDIVVAEGFFMSQNVSVVVGDNLLVIYKGEEAPEEEASIKIDKVIKSVFHNDRYIGMVLQNKGKGGYELRLYNRALYSPMANPIKRIPVAVNNTQSISSPYFTSRTCSMRANK